MQIKEIDIQMSWGSLKAQIFGEQSPDKKPIIALHGFLDNSNSFKPLAEYLTSNKDCYIISIDLPGHGYRYLYILFLKVKKLIKQFNSSHLPTGIYTPKVFLICLRRLIKHFNFKTVTLLAHSYSCSVVLMVSHYKLNCGKVSSTELFISSMQ
jgi:pimeloyl-ACP methyl ester carboxylesterase